MSAKTSTVGKCGAVVIPTSLRCRFGITEGSLVIVEEQADGVLIRPAAAFSLEMYTPERQAEFLLSNAVGPKDYARAKETVRRMGFDAREIPTTRRFVPSLGGPSCFDASALFSAAYRVETSLRTLFTLSRA